MTTPAELDQLLLDQALTRHFAAPAPDLAARVRVALERGDRPALSPEEVARLLAPPRPSRARPLLLLAAVAALVVAWFALRTPRPSPPVAPPLPPVADAPPPVPAERFEALLVALFVPGGHAPTSDPGEVVRELLELERALAEEPARWPRLAAALLEPDLAGAAVAPLDFLHLLTTPRTLEVARELWQRDPGAFGDIHLASLAELGDADFRTELEALVESGEREPCSAPVFSAAFLALRGDARGQEILEAALATPCPDDPARTLAAAFALEELGVSRASARWLELVRATAGEHLARRNPLRAAAWLEADAALCAWRAAPATFRLARLHLELLTREEQRRASPLDLDELARELAELGS